MPKDIKLNATYCFIIKIPGKRELQEVASNNSSDNEFKDFLKICPDENKETF